MTNWNMTLKQELNCLIMSDKKNLTEMVFIPLVTFLNRKNSGVQTAPKSLATSCDCNQAYLTMNCWPINFQR